MFIVLGILIVLFSFLLPVSTRAEIATPKDWIGLFPVGTDDYSRSSGTLTSTPSASFPDGHAWAYTNSCTQTAGTTARLSDLNGCQFSLFPTPIPGHYYVFRLFANNEQTVDALIATSKQLYAGPTASPTPPPPAGKIYRVTGDLTIKNNITVNTTGVVFVDGNLYINKALTNTNPKTGLVFVVQGSINIQRDVETVNAFLITHTGFCSAWDGTTCADYPNETDPRQYLTINGSVVSLNANTTPQFVRKKATLTKAAETINYEPKYLVILKDVFSRDLKIWKEIQ